MASESNRKIYLNVFTVRKALSFQTTFNGIVSLCSKSNITLRVFLFAVVVDNIGGFMCCSYHPIPGSKFGGCHRQVNVHSIYYLTGIISITIYANLIVSFMVKIVGKHLAEHCRIEYPRVTNFILWLLAEISIVACDIPEGKLDTRSHQY